MTDNTTMSDRLLPAWGLLLLVCVIAYWPGLKGPFLFDDMGSISALGKLGGVTDWHTFKAFVLGGNAGPTGRPVSLLTFLIDANNWPTDAWPFKRSNLVIHLLSASVLGLLCRQILLMLAVPARKAGWLAVVSAGVWLLHPFLLSTTLYVVQRMAQLSTLFIFAGLALYLAGRRRVSTNTASAYWTMSIAVVACTGLATFSKENGALLPLLILVLEVTIIASQTHRVGTLNRYWAGLFLLLPSLLIFSYLGTQIFNGQFFELLHNRDYSAWERLLTQSRILVDYLRHWFVPELYTSGVFQDHVLKSTGLLSPVTTALSIAFHIAVLSLAFVKRRQWPLFSFAVLFFYASHLIESTVLNLELYFEHRNYLAAAFLALPAAEFAARRGSRALLLTGAVVLLALLSIELRYSATIWSDYGRMIEAAAHKAPTSARAQQQYALKLFEEQRYEEALQVIDNALLTMPAVHDLHIASLLMRCHLNVLTGSEFTHSANLLGNSGYDPRLYNAYTTLISTVRQRECLQDGARRFRSLFINMSRHPANANPSSLRFAQVRYLLGLVEVENRNPELARQAFEASLAARPGASHAMLMAATLASGEYYEEALNFSDIALTQLDINRNSALNVSNVRKQDILEFQRNIRAELSNGTP